MKKYILVNPTSSIKTQVYPIPKDVICKTEYINGLEQEIIVTTNIFDSIEDADKVRQSIYLGNETLTIHPVEVNPDDILSRDYVSKRFWNGKKITGWEDSPSLTILHDNVEIADTWNNRLVGNHDVIDKPKVLGWVIYNPKTKVTPGVQHPNRKFIIGQKFTVCGMDGTILGEREFDYCLHASFPTYNEAAQYLYQKKLLPGRTDFVGCEVIGLIEKII